MKWIIKTKENFLPSPLHLWLEKLYNKVNTLSTHLLLLNFSYSTAFFYRLYPRRQGTVRSGPSRAKAGQGVKSVKTGSPTEAGVAVRQDGWAPIGAKGTPPAPHPSTSFGKTTLRPLPSINSLSPDTSEPRSLTGWAGRSWQTPRVWAFTFCIFEGVSRN